MVTFAVRAQRGSFGCKWMAPLPPQPRTNAEIRQWYLAEVTVIPELNRNWIRQGLSSRERAQRAWELRHEARIKARSMMADPLEIDLLRERDFKKYGNADGPTFDYLVESLSRAGLAGDEIYEAIVDNSYRTDAELNKKLGL